MVSYSKQSKTQTKKAHNPRGYPPNPHWLNVIYYAKQQDLGLKYAILFAQEAMSSCYNTEASPLWT